MQVQVRCYEELNDFLPPHRRRREFPVRFHEGDTVKALVESLGIPHTEVDLILVNGASVSFRRKLRDGDRVSVYPVFESLDICGVSRVRPQPLRKIRLILDVHLGRLAKLLRMLGFDALYSNDWNDETLCSLSRTDKRILLTRDRELLKRRSVTHGYCVRSPEPLEQLGEVIARFDLARKVKPFTLCLRCNTFLERVPRSQAAAQAPAYVARRYRSFRACPRCGRLYWRGSHWEHMKELLGV